MIVITLPVADGLPVIRGALITKREGKSGYVSVHCKPVNSRWVMLFERRPGRYVVTYCHPKLRGCLPDGISWDDFCKTAAIRKWRTWHVEGTDGEGQVRNRVVRATVDVPTRDATDAEPWTLEGVRVTRAVPTLPSLCGEPDPRVFRRDVLKLERTRGE